MVAIAESAESTVWSRPAAGHQYQSASYAVISSPRSRLRSRGNQMKTIGLIGAGHIGSQLARLAVKNEHEVVISNSRGPETLADIVRELGPHARAATPEEAAQAGDIVVVTIPLKSLRDVPV